MYFDDFYFIFALLLLNFLLTNYTREASELTRLQHSVFSVPHIVTVRSRTCWVAGNKSIAYGRMSTNLRTLLKIVTFCYLQLRVSAGSHLHHTIPLHVLSQTQRPCSTLNDLYFFTWYIFKQCSGSLFQSVQGCW